MNFPFCFYADYPVLDYPTAFRGIEFIEKYSSRICDENRLLRAMDPDALQDCLAEYALRHRATPRALCDNLLEIAQKIRPGQSGADED